MDKLFLRELKIETVIGFHEWERRIKQTVSIDLEIGADSRAAAAVDTERSEEHTSELQSR